MKDHRVLVVEATGDPNVVRGSAFKLLFRTYYKPPVYREQGVRQHRAPAGCCR
jgi:hypothetical protein